MCASQSWGKHQKTQVSHYSLATPFSEFVFLQSHWILSMFLEDWTTVLLENKRPIWCEYSFLLLLWSLEEMEPWVLEGPDSLAFPCWVCLPTQKTISSWSLVRSICLTLDHIPNSPSFISTPRSCSCVDGKAQDMRKFIQQMLSLGENWVASCHSPQSATGHLEGWYPLP